MYEMDEHMVDRWNKTVKDEDIVYHLGDVYFDNGHTVLPRLKGRKRLILGNHDNAKSPHLQNHFQKISMWRMFPEFGLLLTHVHIHQNPSLEGPYRNMSVEAIDYTPINIEELRIK
jgi:calcineurin-like phosphoesterase family protein